MSILNTKNVKIEDQKLFLGPELGLQRYDRFKYPVFFSLFEKQSELFWRPQEISLTKDRLDYQTLEPHEKHIFTSNLLFQTMLDSVVARGVPTLLKHVTSPELEACMNVWQMMETVHSYSYTYIIKNVYANPSELLDSALENTEILKRANSVKEQYDKLIAASNNDLKREIYLTLISVNVLEAVRFYVSFVCAFAFAENKKMIGNADIISLIRRDENLHMAATKNIITILQNNEDEGFSDIVKENKDAAIDMFIFAANEEKEWAKYLFKDGSILGLNENILCNYIEWLVDSRMENIGLPKQFNVKKPVIGSWLGAWMESEKVQVAPQESEITSYKIGSSKNDISDMDLSDMQL